MQVIHLNPELNIRLEDEIAACFGFFDGIHIAHQELFNKCLDIAKDKNLKSAVITFYPNPNFVLNKIDSKTYLTPLEEKTRIIEEMGFDYLFIIDFTLQVAALDHKVFVHKLLKPLNIKDIVVGFDNHYGFKGEGNCNTLEEDSDHTLTVHEVDSINLDGEKVGTTRILKLLALGDIKKISVLLGRNYRIRGRVIHGRGIGKGIGVPTANVGLSYPYSLPKKGVYLCRVFVRGYEKIAIVNLGNNPSFNLVNHLSIEANIIDFNEDIYDEIIEVEFIDHIRDEVKFASIDLFLEEIKKNKASAICALTLTKKIDLYRPSLEELDYRHNLLLDEKTMSFNKLYGGVVNFTNYSEFLSQFDYENNFYYYLQYEGHNIGEISYLKGEVSIIVESKYRSNCLGVNSILTLINLLKSKGITKMTDKISIDNPSINLFLSLGFKVKRIIDDGITKVLIVEKNL